jgi:pyrroloquinoline quinone biosynthesis protein B
MVPHRDEFSETVGYVIEGPSKRVLFIPDIDKWEKWERKIEQVVEETDVSLLDGTFFSNGELPGRDMAEIPHPFISESLNRLGKLPPDQRAKVHFIHLNHSNPALQEGSDAQEEIRSRGFHMARELQRFSI